MIENDIFLRVLRGEATERPPVWLMRQAGRILPQYRAVRESLSGFVELVKSPELVSEVTIQPVDELGVDAAILFSDILVIPEAMGLPYELIEQKGPYFPRTLKNIEDVIALDSGKIAADRLSYVYEAIKITKKNLANRVPLIGFAGAPFTLLCYMVEGKGSKTFSQAKKFLYTQPEAAHLLLDKITEATIAYLHNKIEAGVDAVQIFDSWAGSLDHETYNTFCIPYLQRISDALMPKVPVILFCKGAWFSLKELHGIGSSALGIDWNTEPHFVRSITGPSKVLQGNLDPCVLYADHSFIRKTTIEMIQSFGGHHIVNLGHGVYPDTPLDGVKAFVETIKTYRY
ncbi:MAG: uroporphyrinogen decarboxylase [Saprospiraceae bacterium]|nr:uroporphyrinogen decarboxylase [Saprospiraceae bacterium]